MLDLDRTRIGVEDCQALGELLAVKDLLIGDNNLLIMNGLYHTTTLEVLYMFGSQHYPVSKVYSYLQMHVKIETPTNNLTWFHILK